MPFNSYLIPPDFDLRLFGRASNIRAFESWFSGPRIQNRLICGPRGVGKTTLLKSFFNEDFRRKMAAENKVLIQFCSFNGNRMQTDADVYCRLIESVLDSLRNLGTKSPEYLEYIEAFRKTKQEPEFADYETNRDHGYNLVKEYLSDLVSDGYRVVLVFDDFHHLTCSPNCATETFSNMAGITQNDELISYIVSTDYHINVGSKAYHMSPFERIFASASPIKLGGITVDAKTNQLRFIKEYLHEQIRDFQKFDCDEDEMIDFSDEELDIVFNLTSGIPAMIQHTLNAMYKHRLKNPEILTENIIRKLAFLSCENLMKDWTSHLTDCHWKIFRIVLDGGDAKECDKLPKEDNVSNHLFDTGMITWNIELDFETGDPVQRMCFNCPLFEMYVRRELDRPKKEEPKTELSQNELSVIDKFSEGLRRKFPEGTTVNIEKFEYHEGDVINTNDNSVNTTTTVNARNMQVVQGLSASELIGILTAGDPAVGCADSRALFANSLADKFRKALPSEVFELPARADGMSDAEYDSICDEKFEQIGQRVIKDVEVDSDQEILNVTSEELQTLESRFREAVSRCREGFDLRLLNILSERCGFYFKLAVIVEDALNFPGIFEMQDYSPQLVLYGKVLEQALRDCFYDVFHKDQELSVHDTYIHKRNSKSANAFCNKKLVKTHIGDYAHLMGEKCGYLSEICSINGFKGSGEYLDIPQWKNWWGKLVKEVHEAREIRNKADHASPVSPDRADLNSMFDLLVGNADNEGILSRIEIGERMSRTLFPVSVNQNFIDSIVNQESNMVVLEVKSDGRIRGKLENHNICVKVSKNKFNEYKANNPVDGIVAGTKLHVKILKFSSSSQNNECFFSAEILYPM
ncbi:MAG: ATP-binding protein [Clostridia bacterium]|nr:ATP-binding protein [Clostridia bacterium]